MKSFKTGAMRRLSVITLSVIVMLVTVFGVAPVAQSATGGDDGFAIAAYAADSKPFTGWKKVNGKTLYYLYGKKANGTVIANEKIYLVKKGVSQKGWQKVGDQKFYFKKVAAGKYALTQSKTKSKLVSIKISYVGHKITYDKKTLVKIDKIAVLKKTQQLYFNGNGKILKGNLKNGHVLEYGGKLNYLNASGLVNNKTHKVQFFSKFGSGGWIMSQMIPETKSEARDFRTVFRFGSKKLTGNAQKDTEAIELFKQCKEAYVEWEKDGYYDGVNGKGPTKEQLDKLLSYNWPRYKIAHTQTSLKYWNTFPDFFCDSSSTEYFSRFGAYYATKFGDLNHIDYAGSRWYGYLSVSYEYLLID